MKLPIAKKTKNIDTLTMDLNNFKNQLETQILRHERKQEIKLKIKNLNRLIEIKKYTDILEQIKTNDKALFRHTNYNSPGKNDKLVYCFMYVENPNKLDNYEANCV